MMARVVPRRLRDERGTIAAELAVAAPVLLALMMLVVLAGRVSQAESDVRSAAGEAARAASLRADPDVAAADAESIAASNLATSGVACASLETQVDTSEFRPGGWVTVTVRCTAAMSDVALLGVPGSRAFEASVTEVIDRFRGGS